MLGIPGKHTLQESSDEFFIRVNGIFPYIKALSYATSVNIIKAKKREDKEELIFDLEHNLVHLTNLVDKNMLNKIDDSNAIQACLWLINQIGAIREELGMQGSDMVKDCHKRVIKKTNG